MIKMKKSIFLLCLPALLLVISCNKSNDTTLTITRVMLPGTWMVSETTKKATYEVVIQIDTTTSNGVLISNFAGSGQNVKAIAYLSGSSLSLATNEQLSNQWIVNGSGSFSSTTRIDWPYSLNDGANLTFIHAIYTKK
jgi:hypothetical protein